MQLYQPGIREPHNARAQAMDSVQRLALQYRGMRVFDLAVQLGYPLPQQAQHAKGWLGGLLEHALGADAGNAPVPDITACGLEIKTLPIGASGRVQESTYLTSCPLSWSEWHAWGSQWETTPLAQKIAYIVWIPILEAAIPTPLCRTIGSAFITRCVGEIADTIQTDWYTIREIWYTEGIEGIPAGLGRYLQVRPKAANGRALRRHTDANGKTARTLPRGFYLRARCTQQLYQQSLGQ